MEQPIAKKPKLHDNATAENQTNNPEPSNKSEACENLVPEEECSYEKPVKESEVGITEFISNHRGFQGIIKQRYSDFLVNEINLEGEIVRLTNTDVPACDTDKKNAGKEHVPVLTDKQLEDLKLLAEGKADDRQVLIQVGEDKKARSDIHQAIRELFPVLISQTENINDAKYIVVTRSDSSGNSNSTSGWKRKKRQEPWIHKDYDYCHCILYKENKDTMFAVNLLAKYLGIRTNVITYAGTKDKRAKTCQQISVYRVTASRLHLLNEKLRDMALGNFRYCKEPLALGDLKGNHFVIVLRSFVANDEDLQQAMSSLKTYGFINYYGMQRFGTTSVPTHLVGRALLRSSWQEAIELIMKPRQSGTDPIFEVRQCWSNEHDPGKALKILGKRTCPEYHLLNGLKNKSENDFVGALGCIPRNNRLMYVHAYQSYLWNRLASERIKQYGLKPVVGDLVIQADMITDMSEDNITGETLPEASQKRVFVEPTVVTDENIAEYTVHDVVLPLVGYDVIYPQNTIGDLYQSWLAEDELSVDKLKHKVKDYSLRGAYRHIVIRPKNLGWKVIPYSDPHVPLVLSDIEKLRGETPPAEVTDGKFRALKLEYSLPPSTYATMALREVLKQDTSATHQSSLTSAAMEVRSTTKTSDNTETSNSHTVIKENIAT